MIFLLIRSYVLYELAYLRQKYFHDRYTFKVHGNKSNIQNQEG